jgi:hypothetical protein
MHRLIAVAAIGVMASMASAQPVDLRDALLSPLPVRDQFLLSNGFFFFTPEAPRTLPEGQWSFALNAADANSFAKSAWISHSLAGRTTRSEALQTLSDSRFESTASLFLVDGETHRTDMTLSHGLAGGLELRVTVPVVSTGGGWSDRVIESVHHAMKIGNAQRESLNRNSETVYLRHDGKTYVRSRGNGFSVGDIALGAKYSLDRSLSVVTSIELPTGNAHRLDGSGSIDAGVELLATRDLSHTTRINLSLGVIRLGANEALGTRSQLLITDTVGIARRVGTSASVLAQLTVSESPFRQFGMYEFSRRTYQLATGFQRQIGGLLVHAAFIENVVNFENSADAGLAWGVSKRF